MSYTDMTKVISLTHRIAQTAFGSYEPYKKQTLHFPFCQDVVVPKWQREQSFYIFLHKIMAVGRSIRNFKA